MPLISIIVPIYNVEAYLPECLDSLINQSFKDIEIILVNDGSTDNSLTICEKYKNIDNRITIINQTNLGVSIARNKGIEHAKGEYISFVDPDDYVNLHAYEIFYNKTILNNADLVVAGYHRFDAKTNKIIKSEHNTEVERCLCLNNPIDIAFLGNAIPKALTSACARLYKKSLFTHLRFPLRLKYEDTFIYMEIINLAKRIVLIPEYLYYYRINRPYSIMTTHSKYKIDITFIDVTAKFIEDYYHFIKNSNIPINFAVKLYRRLFATLLLYDKDNTYATQREVIRKRLLYFSKQPLKSRYKWELKFLCYFPKIYKLIAAKRL